MTNLKICI